MGEFKTIVAAGGLVMKDDKYLLVRTTYGGNKGLWMLPGGIVEPGESVEDAAIREVLEESGITAKILGIQGVRTGVRIWDGYDQTNIYIAYLMSYVEGEGQADGNETSEVEFFSLEEVKVLIDIVGLSKELIISSCEGKCLNKQDIGFEVKNDYKRYDLYTVN